MSDDSPTAYEVLGVDPAAGHDDIRRAYRRLLRETHPDLGGSSTRFHAVQRAWATIETPALRRAYDLRLPRRLHGQAASDAPASAGAPGGAAPEFASEVPGSAAGASSGPAGFAPAASGPAAEPAPGPQFSPPSRRDARGPAPASAPRARSYGHPGGEARSHFFSLLREWAGRGASVENPYDPVLLRSAPREVRGWLAKAVAEEATATLVGVLGPDFTIWNDVIAGSDGIVDHVVLGPSGAYAISSEDWGTEVTVERGEIESTRLEPGETPVKWFMRRAKILSKSTGVRFAGLLMVLPDRALSSPMVLADRRRSGSTVVLRRELLPAVLTSGAPDWGLATAKPWSTDELYRTREHLQERLKLA